MHSITIQLAADKTFIPKKSLLKKWVEIALQNEKENEIEKEKHGVEITIRIVDVEEMSALNFAYRKKNGPTNVLSFPFSIPEEIDLDIPILGDIVICADVVNREAQEQHKTREAHWAHMIIHGVFHLLGYDHETDEEATIMENLEIKKMQLLGFANPYAAAGEK